MQYRRFRKWRICIEVLEYQWHFFTAIHHNFKKNVNGTRTVRVRFHIFFFKTMTFSPNPSQPKPEKEDKKIAETWACSYFILVIHVTHNCKVASYASAKLLDQKPTEPWISNIYFAKLAATASLFGMRFRCLWLRHDAESATKWSKHTYMWWLIGRKYVMEVHFPKGFYFVP